MRLNEVAHVYDGVENERNAGWYNGARTIYLAIQRQPGTNTVEVVDRIKALLPQLGAAAAGVGPAARSAATARCRSASRWTT